MVLWRSFFFKESSENDTSWVSASISFTSTKNPPQLHSWNDSHSTKKPQYPHSIYLSETTKITLLESSEDNAWHLSFNKIPRSERDEKPQQRGLQDCFSVLDPSSGDGGDEYYQQQDEMLDGFTEMDTVAERGFLPGMSEVWSFRHIPSNKLMQH